MQEMKDFGMPPFRASGETDAHRRTGNQYAVRTPRGVLATSSDRVAPFFRRATRPTAELKS
jgi:hypothetical protein